METKELNKELKEEVNKIFAALFKEIGSNRQQLANKVLNHHKEVNKELNKDEVSEPRRKEILSEIARTVKMAAQQLPHLKISVVKPTTPAQPVAAKGPVTATPPAKIVKPVPPKTPAEHKKASPPKEKVAAVKAKPASAAKKTATTPKKKKK